VDRADIVDGALERAERFTSIEARLLFRIGDPHTGNLNNSRPPPCRLSDAQVDTPIVEFERTTAPSPASPKEVSSIYADNCVNQTSPVLLLAPTLEPKFARPVTAPARSVDAIVGVLRRPPWVMPARGCGSLEFHDGVCDLRVGNGGTVEAVIVSISGCVGPPILNSNLVHLVNSSLFPKHRQQCRHDPRDGGTITFYGSSKTTASSLPQQHSEFPRWRWRFGRY